MYYIVLKVQKRTFEKRARRHNPRKWEAHGGVAQLGERLPCKQEAIGSNPFISTRSCCSEKKKEEKQERARVRKKPAESENEMGS